MPLPITRFRPEPFAFLQYSGFEQPATLVVRTQQTWQSAWDQMYVNYGQKPPLPAIDFSREMIVIAAAGIKNTGGYNIVLTGASETDGVVTIQVLENGPGSNCGVTLALTQPVDLARLARRDGTVLFSVMSNVKDCS